MAASIADVAFGVILKKETSAGSGTYTDWGVEITNLQPPGWTREAVDVTHHQSPNGWGENIFSAIKKQKAFPITFNWDPSMTGTIKTAFEDGKANWKIEIPDGSSVIVAAGITDFDPQDMTPEGKMAASATFTPSGEPAWA